MSAAGSRTVGFLSGPLRSAECRGCIAARHHQRRYIETARDTARRESLPASMIPGLGRSSASQSPASRADSEDPLKLDILGDEGAADGNRRRPPRAVQAAYLRPLKRTPKYRIPSCDLQLRSYSVRNLEFFTTFALRAAYFLKLPAVGPVPLPKQIERWTVPKGHFVHKKSQENFERITLKRLIQIQDGHPETIQIWLAYLRKRAYYGVGMKANVWAFDKLGIGREMDATANAAEPLDKKWPSTYPDKLTPEVQAEVDKWLAEHDAEDKADLYGTEGSTAENNLEFEEPDTASITVVPTRSLTSPEVTTFSEAQSLTQQPDAPEAGTKARNISPIREITKSTLNRAQPTQTAPDQNVPEALLASNSQAKISEGSEVEKILAQVELEAKVAESQKKTTQETSTRAPVKQSATKSTTKEAASVKDAVQPPTASGEDTTKNIDTPEEADPSVEPTTEQAKEAEAEDAEQPLGDLPKTPS